MHKADVWSGEKYLILSELKKKKKSLDLYKPKDTETDFFFLRSVRHYARKYSPSLTGAWALATVATVVTLSYARNLCFSPKLPSSW